MPVDCLEVGQTLTARITGEVDHHAARSLMGQLTGRVETALPMELTLDMEGVTFMDSSGIALVLRLWRQMAQLGGRLCLRNIPRQAEKVLKTAGVDKLVPLSGKDDHK